MYLGNRDIINIVDALARDKGIQKEHLIVGIESAIEEIGKTKYGTTHPIKARFNRKTGEINLYRVLSVVEAFQVHIGDVVAVGSRQAEAPI